MIWIVFSLVIVYLIVRIFMERDEREIQANIDAELADELGVWRANFIEGTVNAVLAEFNVVDEGQITQSSEVSLKDSDTSVLEIVFNEIKLGLTVNFSTNRYCLHLQKRVADSIIEHRKWFNVPQNGIVNHIEINKFCDAFNDKIYNLVGLPFDKLMSEMAAIANDSSFEQLTEDAKMNLIFDGIFDIERCFKKRCFRRNKRMILAYNKILVWMIANKLTPQAIEFLRKKYGIQIEAKEEEE